MTSETSIPSYVRFLMGGTAGMAATCIVQPMDLVKTRMQMSGIAGVAKEHKTAMHALLSISKKEGIFALYNGLSAGLLRQATYTTVRLGIYTNLTDNFKGADGNISFSQKCLFGMIAGAVGAFVGTPAEIALIRMTNDGRLPKSEQRAYKNVFNALFRITTEEGVFTLWRGCTPTVVRAIFVNAAQLATYAQSKQMLLETKYFEDNIMCHFAASMVSGLATTWASLPADIVKTRIQSMKVINGKPEYKNGLDVLTTVVKREGLFALWKGFTPCYLRIAPHTVFTFIFLEQFQNAAKRYFVTQR
ncbi:mitochondrial 2-oxoglutarate/malate carrier protein isoform X1 [Hydra vulgaris]|nr:mitochondrial 2-oxoglutarate/malate carrier protein-like [Hydra vulgaris]